MHFWSVVSVTFLTLLIIFQPKDEWMREKRELERNIAELQTALRAGRGVSNAKIRNLI